MFFGGAGNCPLPALCVYTRKVTALPRPSPSSESLLDIPLPTLGATDLHLAPTSTEGSLDGRRPTRRGIWL